MSDSPLPFRLDLADTYGAFYIGILVTAMLFGITNLQVFFYFTTYQRDWIGHKLSVYWLWFLDAFHLALISHVGYYYLVSNYDNPLGLLNIVWTFKMQIVTSVIVVESVQTLYVIRLIKLNSGQRKIVSFLGGAIMLGAYGVGITQCCVIFWVHTFPEVAPKIGWSTYMTLGCATSVDAIIAAALCYTLAKRRTGFSKTDSTLDALMIYILNTGILTSLCSITIMIVYATMPDNFIFLALEFLVTKLYINSYMAMLNARRYIGAHSRQSSGDVELTSQEHATINISRSRPSGAQVSKLPPSSPFSHRVDTFKGSYSPSPTQFDQSKSQESDVDLSEPKVMQVRIQKEAFSHEI